MIEQNVVGIARMVLRKNSLPKMVALVPQLEIVDENGQKQPPGLNAVVLPYADDIRQNRIPPQVRANPDQGN